MSAFLLSFRQGRVERGEALPGVDLNASVLAEDKREEFLAVLGYVLGGMKRDLVLELVLHMRPPWTFDQR